MFVGDDWAEEHHDIEVQDETGKALAKKRLPEDLVGMVALHELLGRHVPASWADLDPAEAAAKVIIVHAGADPSVCSRATSEAPVTV